MPLCKPRLQRDQERRLPVRLLQGRHLLASQRTDGSWLDQPEREQWRRGNLGPRSTKGRARKRRSQGHLSFGQRVPWPRPQQNPVAATQGVSGQGRPPSGGLTPRLTGRRCREGQRASLAHRRWTSHPASAIRFSRSSGPNRRWRFTGFSVVSGACARGVNRGSWRDQLSANRRRLRPLAPTSQSSRTAPPNSRFPVW